MAESNGAFEVVGDKCYRESGRVAGKRMEGIWSRLPEFRVRSHGVLPSAFSWGTAEAAGRVLREGDAFWRRQDIRTDPTLSLNTGEHPSGEHSRGGERAGRGVQPNPAIVVYFEFTAG